MRFLYVMFVIFLLPLVAEANPSHKVIWNSGVNIKVVNSWSKSLDKISNVNSVTYIDKKSGGKDKLHRTGHRDVIVWIPETTNLSKNFILVVWFHGHYGYVPHRTFEDRTLKQLAPLSGAKNFVLVLPEMPWSIHTTTPTKRNSLLWQKSGDFLKFIDSIHVTLKSHNNSDKLGKIDYRIVGHSAGGSTIKRIALTGDLCKLSPTMVVWSDSSYGSWLDNAWTGCLNSSPDILVKVFVHKGGPPWRSANRFLNKNKIKPKNLKLYVKSKGWSHKLIGNKIVDISQLLE